MKTILAWIRCMRLQTLPVSAAGVIIAIFLTRLMREFNFVPAALCLTFAILAQIVSNMVNEYYDFKRGADKPGRVGFKRSLAEGDVSAESLYYVVIGLIITTAAVGCAMIPYGGWWLVPVGIVIGLGAMAYSAGPYPLSYHALGELAVFIFFGLVPVNMTFYVIAGRFSILALFTSMAVGFMGVNVLLVNNYRDCDEDRANGKRTATVITGKRLTAVAYFLNGLAAMVMTAPFWILCTQTHRISGGFIIALYVYSVCHIVLTGLLVTLKGRKLNLVLSLTAILMFVFALIMAYNMEYTLHHHQVFYHW